MKKYSLVLLVLLFGSLSSWAGASSALDGMKFAGTVTEEGKQKGDEDILFFDGGAFVSEACVPYGFGKAPYSATGEKDGVAWHCEVPSTKHQGEKLIWDGIVKGDKLTGTMLWVKADGKTITYSIQATKK